MTKTIARLIRRFIGELTGHIQARDLLPGDVTEYGTVSDVSIAPDGAVIVRFVA